MNLAIDIGNTQVKFALFNRDEMIQTFAQGEMLEEILNKNKVSRAIISKSGADTEIEDILDKREIAVFHLSQRLKLPVHIAYKTLDTLGTDRIAGSVAANFLFPGTDVLKIDFGTCITYDFINSQNQYLGGAISPGMMMRFKAMHNYTAKLPLVDPMQFTSFELTGEDTATSILSGVINGIKHEVEGIIKEYEKRSGRLMVVGTGGDMGIFVTMVNSKIFARPHLVLEGLNRILNYNL